MSSPDHSKVFISHRHEDSTLAGAWRDLLHDVSAGQIESWFSSDDRPGSGVQPGNWYEQLQDHLKKSSAILVIVTPGVVEGPWVLFESGYAVGSRLKIVVVYYYMSERNVPDVLKRWELYDGCDPKSVRKICNYFMLGRLGGGELPVAAIAAWDTPLNDYTARVAAEEEDCAKRALFHDQFHQYDAAEGMKGTWHARWTQIGADGREEDFEIDELLAWTTRDRIRFVGTSAKKGIDGLALPERYYPMEGVVSNDRWVALSYWGGGNLSICGTVLLRRRDTTGELFEGHWQGYTTRDIHEDAAFMRGRVVLARAKDRLLNYWNSEATAV